MILTTNQKRVRSADVSSLASRKSMLSISSKISVCSLSVYNTQSVVVNQ